MTPAPMNSMLDKQCVEEALQKRRERKAMEVKDVPPTSTGIDPLVLLQYFLKA